MNTQKEKALARLTEIEKETKELRKIIEAPESLRPITERVKTFEDACSVLGVSTASKGTGNDLIDGDIASIQAYAKLCIIVRALNEGWKPDWSNGSENKYYPYFKYSKSSGFGFSVCDCDCGSAGADVGSRLVFKNRELAEYAAKQFQKEYNEFLTLN